MACCCVFVAPTSLNISLPGWNFPSPGTTIIPVACVPLHKRLLGGFLLGSLGCSSVKKQRLSYTLIAYFRELEREIALKLLYEHDYRSCNLLDCWNIRGARGLRLSEYRCRAYHVIVLRYRKVCQAGLRTEDLLAAGSAGVPGLARVTLILRSTAGQSALRADEVHRRFFGCRC